MTSNQSKFIPYEKTNFSNFNGGSSINIPKWEYRNLQVFY